MTKSRRLALSLLLFVLAALTAGAWADAGTQVGPGVAPRVATAPPPAATEKAAWLDRTSPER